MSRSSVIDDYDSDHAGSPRGTVPYELGALGIALDYLLGGNLSAFRYLSFAGNVLTLTYSAALLRELVSLSATTFSGIERNSTASVQLIDGEVDFGPDGKLTTLSGDVQFFFRENSSGSRETELFVPVSIESLIERATGIGPDNSLRYAGEMMNSVIPDKSVDYFYSGSGAGEDVYLGRGSNFASVFGGNDRFWGKPGGGEMDGGVGNDRFNVNPGGRGALLGGDGKDAFSASTWNVGVKLNLDAGTAQGVGLKARYTLDSIEDGYGSNLADRLIGNLLKNTLKGAGGADLIDGGNGNDRLYGQGGADTVLGGGGRDFIYTGGGNDNAEGGAGGDTLKGGKGKDTLSGGDSNDTINGGDGNDELFGGKGDDSILGGTGRDVLEGGEGNDTLNGGDGKDLLKGDEGNDVMTGGRGADAFLFVPKVVQGDDVIEDFKQDDHIRFIQNALTFGDLRITTTPEGDSLIRYDDGAGGENSIRVKGVIVTEDNFEFFGL